MDYIAANMLNNEKIKEQKFLINHLNEASNNKDVVVYKNSKEIDLRNIVPYKDFDRKKEDNIVLNNINELNTYNIFPVNFKGE